MSGGIARGENKGVIPALFAYFDGIAGFSSERRNVHFAAIHSDVAVAYELARLGPAGGKPHPIHNVIEALLQQTEHQLACNTFLINGLLVKIPELAFKNAVV